MNWHKIVHGPDQKEIWNTYRKFTLADLTGAEAFLDRKLRSALETIEKMPPGAERADRAKTGRELSQKHAVILSLITWRLMEGNGTREIPDWNNEAVQEHVNGGIHESNKAWVVDTFNSIRSDHRSDDKAFEALQALYAKEFNGLKISKSTIRRFLGKKSD